MNKRKVVFVLASALLIAGCANTPTEDSSSSSSSPASSSQTSVLPDSSDLIPDPESSISSEPYVDPTPSYSASDIYSLVKAAASSNNFTIKETVLSEGILPVEYFTYYTDNYVHYSYADAGYVRLTDYTGESTLMYNYSNASNPVIENALSYNLDAQDPEAIAIRDVTTLNPLVDGASELSADDIKLNYSYYYCQDSTLIEAFSYFLGASTLASKIYAVKFTLNETKTELNFSFVPNFSSGASDSDIETIDGLSGVLSAVKATSIASLDSFVATYSLPENSIGEELIATIPTSGEIHSIVTYSYEGNTSDVIEQEDHVTYSPTARQITRNVKGVSAASYSYYTKDAETGHVIDNYIDYSNAVATKDLGGDFDKDMPTPSSLFEEGAFRAVSGDVYTYYGYQGRAFINDLVDFDCGSILSIEVTVEDGVIASLKAITPTRYDSYGQKMHYEVEVSFQGEGTIAPLVPDSAKDWTVYGALNSFQDSYGYGLMYSFTATIATETGANNYKTTLSLFKKDSLSSYNDVLLFDQESVDTSEGSSGDPIHIRYGYYLKDESGKEVIPFKINDNGEAIASEATMTGVNLGNILGFDIDCRLFVKTSEDTDKGQWQYRLRKEAKDASSHIIGGSHASYLIPSSLTLDISTQTVGTYSLKMLDKLEYEFNAEDFYKGKESVTFSNYGATSAPTDIDFSTLKDWVEPETWEDGAPEVYDRIVACFGEETASKLPFLYQKDIEGHWLSGEEAYNEFPNDGYAIRWMMLCNDSYLVEGDTGVSKAYMEAFAAKLKKNGFVEADYPLGHLDSDIATLYSEELDLYVRIPDSVGAGIRLLRKEPLSSSSSSSSAE